MRIDVTVALLGHVMAPPFLPVSQPGDQTAGDLPAWGELPKTHLRVSPSETLGAIIDRAAPSLGVWLDERNERVGGHVSDFMDGISLFEGDRSWPVVISELVVVEDDGRASWGHRWRTVTYDEFARSRNLGLVDGDPTKLYLRASAGGGGGGATEWETFLQVVDTCKDVFVAVGVVYASVQGLHAAVGLLRRGGEALRGRYEEWSERGGTPSEVSATLSRRPWSTESIAELLGVDAQTATAVLEMFGHVKNEAGRWELASTDVPRLVSGTLQLVLFSQQVLGDTAPAEVVTRLRPLLQERAEYFAVSGAVPPEPDTRDLNVRLFGPLPDPD
jgi:hypothetical protein